MKATQANYFISTPETASNLFEQLSQSIRRKSIRQRRIQSQIDFMPLFGAQLRTGNRALNETENRHEHKSSEDSSN